MDVLEQNAFMTEGVNISEKLSGFRKNFTSAVAPENGSYGITRIDKGNGLEAFRGKTPSGHPFMEYYQDGKLTMRRESLGNHQLMKTSYDDKGTAYLRTITEAGKSVNYELTPNATITKGNFVATTDAYGRTISTKVTDITLKDGGYHPVSKLRDRFYLMRLVMVFLISLEVLQVKRIHLHR